MALSKAEMETFESLTGCRNDKEVRNTRSQQSSGLRGSCYFQFFRNDCLGQQSHNNVTASLRKASINI